MSGPETHNHPTEDFENKTNAQPGNIASTLGEEMVISAQEHKERFATAPKILQDTFIVQDDGSFLVKSPEESQVMQGHLRDLPIVPGIVLKRLYLHQTQTKAKGTVSANFISGAFSGQTIMVQKGGIYTPAGKKMVDISIDTKEEIPAVNDTPDISYMPMYEEEMDDYLLQQKAFRFVSRGEKDGVMKNDSRFRGRFDIPEDFQWTENGNISPEILEEIGAQVGSFVTGPDLNNDKPLIHEMNNETQLNPNSKIFTFKVGKSKTTEHTAKAGESVYVKGRVIIFDPNGKDAHFCYRAENEQGQTLISGEIKGQIVKLNLLIYGYGKSKNSPQKQ